MTRRRMDGPMNFVPMTFVPMTFVPMNGPMNGRPRLFDVRRQVLPLGHPTDRFPRREHIRPQQVSDNDRVRVHV